MSPVAETGEMNFSPCSIGNICASRPLPRFLLRNLPLTLRSAVRLAHGRDRRRPHEHVVPDRPERAHVADEQLQTGHHAADVRERDRGVGRGLRPGLGRELDVLRRRDVQVQERRGVRPGQLAVLLGLVHVRAEHAGVPAQQGRPLRHRRDVHGQQRGVPRGRRLAQRAELWVGRVGVRERAVYFAQS